MADHTSHSGITRWSQGIPIGPANAHVAKGGRSGEWHPKQQTGFPPIVEYRYGQWQGPPRQKSLPALRERIVREPPPSPGSPPRGSFQRATSFAEGNFYGLALGDTRAFAEMPPAGVST